MSEWEFRILPGFGMNKKLAVIGGLVGVCALFFLGKRSGEELTMPSCEVMEKVETPIHFFTGDFVSDERLQEYVDYSNLVLDNSCVPMRRTIAYITRINLKDFESHDTGRLHKQLIDTVGGATLKPMQKKGRYYGLILPEGHAFGRGGFVGEAHLNFSRSFL